MFCPVFFGFYNFLKFYILCRSFFVSNCLICKTDTMSRVKRIIEVFFNAKYRKQEKFNFYKWLNASYDTDEKEEALNDYWSKIEATANAATEDAYKKTCQNINRINRFQTVSAARRNVIKWVAIIALPLLMMFGAKMYIDYSQAKIIVWVEVCTKYGEKKSVVLPDGSVIILNSGSKLIYPKEFRGKSRQAFLSGEGYATITRNEDKPFILSAGDINIDVLGTSFNVKSYMEDSEIEIALVEGSVLVHIPTNNVSFNLKPGEVIKYDKVDSNVTKRQLITTDYRSNATSSNLYFIENRLRDIVLQLERSFDVQIVVTDKSVLDDRYYAVFVNNENAYQILQFLNVDKALNIVRENNIIYIHRNQ